MTGDSKPVYSMSMKCFGLTGLFLFLFGFSICLIMFFWYGSDFTLFFVLQGLFILGAFTGRVFEGNYHKRVLSHMTPEYQKLYRKMARCIAEYDKDVGDVEVVKCDGCGCDTIVSRFDEHLCQRCLEEKKEVEIS